MSKAVSKRPFCVIIAGRNGAGKTTFAREYLPKDTAILHFVNTDLIAGGLSPLPRVDVIRRFDRSWLNFQNVCRLLADEWTVYDNSRSEPTLVERSR